MERSTLGQFCAYVEAGESIMDRRARLAEVPEEMRESVRAHVATVFLLREAARRKTRMDIETAHGR